MGDETERGEVVVVDDNVDGATNMQEALEDSGFRAVAFFTIASAFRYVRDNPGVKLVLCDVKMSDGGVASLLELFAEHRITVPVAAVSGFNADNSVRHCNIVRFFVKPVNMRELVGFCETQLRR